MYTHILFKPTTDLMKNQAIFTNTSKNMDVFAKESKMSPFPLAHHLTWLLIYCAHYTMFFINTKFNLKLK